MSWSDADTRRRALLQAAALLMFAAVAGCGFRLQGVGAYPPSMATTYIDARDTYTEFYRGLAASLAQGGVDLVDSAAEARTVIRITEDRTGQRVLTVSGRNVPTEFDIYYSVSYSVWIDGAEVLPERTLVKRQDYTYDTLVVLGKRREEQMLREAVASDLVRQVSQQLARL
jgi:outer membrane lipopolysaccharide assembly protein LptE/RlpB